MRNDRTMPFGERGEHITVRLIDFDNPENNELIVCNQWTYKAGQLETRFDIVLLINGLPVVIGEAKNARAACGRIPPPPRRAPKRASNFAFRSSSRTVAILSANTRRAASP